MKNHKDTSKGFIQLSRAYYGKYCLDKLKIVDQVTFGFYAKDGSTTGEITVEWISLAGKVVPELSIFSDAWNALSKFHDLIDLLGEHDSEDTPPEEFCKLLRKCGFKDMTIEESR